MLTRSSPRRPRILLIAVALFVLALVVVSVMSGDRPGDPPEIVDALWRAQVDGAPAVLYVTRQSRVHAVRIPGRSRGIRYDPYTRYELVLRRLPGGEIVQVHRLADLRDVAGERAPRVLGVSKDMVWLWRDSLEGRRLPDLTVQLTAGTLVPTPPAAIEALPTEARAYKTVANIEGLVMRGRDARFYRIDGATGTMALLDPALLPPTSNSTRIEDRFNSIVAPGRSQGITHPYWVMQKSFGTSTGRWYALLSESERAGVSRWPRGEDRPSGEVARALYATAFTLDDRNHPEIVPSSVQPLGTERLIEAGFLVRHAGRVWDVPDPSSSLVLARERLGSNEPWQVVRLTRTGTVLWRTSTELAAPYAMLDLGTHLAFLGPSLGEKPGLRRQRLVWIDERTGTRRSLLVASGELR